MAKPNSQKEVGAEGAEKQQGKKGGGLIVNIITTTLICSMFLILNYKMVNDASKNLQVNNQEEQEEAVDEVVKGYLMDLGEPFTINLADAAHKSFLKTEVAIEVTTNENDVLEAAGGEGHGKAAQPTLADELERYKPAIRDAIITILSSKTSDELATTTGKELAKEQIIEQINAIFAGEREVLRISFKQFIMQQGR